MIQPEKKVTLDLIIYWNRTHSQSYIDLKKLKSGRSRAKSANLYTPFVSFSKHSSGFWEVHTIRSR